MESWRKISFAEWADNLSICFGNSDIVKGLKLQPSKCLLGKKNLLHSLLGCRVDKVAIRIKLSRRLISVQEKLGFVYKVKIKINPDMAIMILSPGTT
ncbi:hypothetical protein V6N13_138255 [Hibiscus sabdariffa]